MSGHSSPAKGLIATKVFDASGTYTKNPDANFFEVEVFGSGGGGGAYASAAGANGGTVSFGAYMTATGGQGGNQGGLNYSGNAHGLGTGGDVNIAGGGHAGGGDGVNYQGSGNNVLGQRGASGGYSFKRFEANELTSSVSVTVGNGGAGGVYGSWVGSAGAKGKVIVREYA